MLLNPGPSPSLNEIPTWKEGGQFHAQIRGLVVCADTVEALIDLIWELSR